MAIFVVIIIIAALGYIYLDNKHYTGYSVIWEKEIGSENVKAENFRGYEDFAGGIIKYSKDGASFVDSSGKIIWERSYQMNNPVIAVRDGYAAIADRGGYDIYIFNHSGNTGAAKAVLPVTKVEISSGGLVYAILRDADADYVTAFNKDGSAVVLSIKSVLTGDGYPLDIAVSPDGTQLLTSYFRINNSAIETGVVFRNFGDVGQSSDARRVVGGFTDEFAGHMPMRVNFSDETYSQVFYDGGIVFFSTRVLTSPEVIKKVEFEEEINSIAYSDDYAGVILNQPGAELPYRIELYKKNGDRMFSAETDFPYEVFEISGDYVLLYNENECRVYTARGREKLSCSFEMSISKMLKGRYPGEFLVAGENKMWRIKMS